MLIGQLLHRGDDVLGEMREAGRLVLQLHRARVVAADLQQIGQERLEALHLCMQQLRGAGGRRIEGVALVVEHVAGQADGRQWCAQLVGDVGDEALLHERELGELLDLGFDAVGHRVERAAEDRELVLPSHRQPHSEIAGSEGRAGFGGLGDRNGHRAQHEGGDRRDQQHEPGAHEPQGDLDELQGLLLRGEVVGEVELVGADLGKLELLPDDDPGHRAAVGGRQADGLPPALLAVALNGAAQSGRDQPRGQPSALEVLRRDRRRLIRNAERGDHVGPGLPRDRIGRVVPQRLQCGTVAVDLRGVERLLGGLRSALHGLLHLLDAGLEEVVLDRERHRDERDEDGQSRRTDRDDERAKPQRPGPRICHTARPAAPVAPAGQRRHGRRLRRHERPITPPRRRDSRRRAPS